MSDRSLTEYRQLTRDLSAEMNGERVPSDDVKPYTQEELESAPFVISAELLRDLDDCLERNHVQSGKRIVARLVLAARAGLEDRERLDWLEKQNANVRGDSPILPPSCGFSVRQYIDQHIANEAIPRATRSGRRDGSDA